MNAGCVSAGDGVETFPVRVSYFSAFRLTQCLDAASGSLIGLAAARSHVLSGSQQVIISRQSSGTPLQSEIPRQGYEEVNRLQRNLISQ